MNNNLWQMAKTGLCILITSFMMIICTILYSVNYILISLHLAIAQLDKLLARLHRSVCQSLGG